MPESPQCDSRGTRYASCPDGPQRLRDTETFMAFLVRSGPRTGTTCKAFRSVSLCLCGPFGIESAGANVFISNAPGSHESTTAGDPHRPSPISAVSLAISVEVCSGDGSGRVNSEYWRSRAGVGSTATHTRSIAAAGGCDSRSKRASVRRVRASRMGVGSCSVRSCTVRVTRCSRTCRTAAPRPRRSRCAASGSINRPSTKESGSRPSIGHSRSIACSKRSSGTTGRSGRGSSPRASRCHRTPCCPSRAAMASGGNAATSPSVRRPQRRRVCDNVVRGGGGARVRGCEGCERCGGARVRGCEGARALIRRERAPSTGERGASRVQRLRRLD